MRSPGRSLASATSPVASGGRPSAGPLSGRSLILARARWLIIAVLALGLFVAGIPSEFATLETACQTGCVAGQLSPVEFDALRDLGLSPDFYAAYGVVLEALNDAARHADARNGEVRLALDEEAGELRVEVIGDGKGIAGDHRTGVGLSSMRERAVELGGLFEIEAVPSGGTPVRASLPCAREEKEA